MTSLERSFLDFAKFAAKLKGDEKSEAQTFLFHLLEAFHHDANTLPDGSTFEYRVRFPGQKTKFADFVWPGHVLIEMKSRGVKLSRHYQQTFDYWLNLVPYRPPYVVLCNFDELWIYDFNTQLNEPVDRVRVSELVERHSALNFLFFRPLRPIFGNNWVQVTREAANNVALAFNETVLRGEPRDSAQRFILQCVVAMFSEDIGLLPNDLFTALLDECLHGANSYDLIGGLFRQMNEPRPARGGRYAGVDYFNGGLFAKVEPIELQPHELGLLFEAAKENWSYVQPVIFGTLFEGSLGKKERHALGAHFTYESDIQKIVRPTIVRPWDERIAAAKTAKELRQLLIDLRTFRVLDPACGSGNFLYVAFRTLRELEQRVLLRLATEYEDQFATVGLASHVSPRQFFGLDVNPVGVEVAKVTLMLARRLATRDAEKFWDDHRDVLPGSDTAALQFEKDLPLDNLDDNILCRDALFTPWPEVEAIIGNPPFQSKNKMQKEFGPAYVQKLRKAFPEIPGRADFCVYWFRKAHDHLKPGCRAGLVGTNTIRQNYSREGGLDYIVQENGTITEAVSSQVWSGESVVHVSIVNWIKGEQKGKKKLFAQLGDNLDSPWKCDEVDVISSSLSTETDVAAAKRLSTNADSGVCYQGQTHGHEGFLLTTKEVQRLLKDDKRNKDVVLPYLTADDLLTNCPPSPSRFVIDFHPRDVMAAARYKAPFAIVKKLVLPAREAAAEEEKKRNREVLDKSPEAHVNHHHANFLKKWWLLGWARAEMVNKIGELPRYIACGQVTKRPIFEFISSEIRPNAALIVFALADDYSFGILQSGPHWNWFKATCSTLKADFRYTSDTVTVATDTKTIDNPRRTLDDLVSRAIAYRTSNELRELFEFCRRFPHIAPYNAMLLHVQNPGIAYALRARDWETLYVRRVRPAARPYVILQTMGPVAFVFDLSDTEPIGLTDNVPDIVKNPFPAKGQPPGEALPNLFGACATIGIKIETRDYASNQAGRVERVDRNDYQFHIALNSKHSASQQLGSLAHELGHVFCGHLGETEDGFWHNRGDTKLPVREFEAEGVAYLVTDRYHLDIGSVQYLAGYLKDNQALPDYSLDAILRAAGKIEEMAAGRFRPKQKAPQR